MCDRLRAEGLEPLVRQRTGLLLDPYFSASTIAWLLEHTPICGAGPRRARFAFGTVDSFLALR